MSWQREYPVHAPAGPLLLGAATGALLGLILLPPYPIAGVTLLLLAGVAVLLRQAVVPSQSVACGPAGFTVSTRQGRGLYRVAYSWHEVAATRYEQRRRGGRSIGYFVVETAAGTAFAASQRTPHFRDMIEVFNAMTPHLPYIWQGQGDSADLHFAATARPPVWPGQR